MTRDPHDDPAYVWSIDAFRSWEVGNAALREKAIREGRIAPANDTEARWAAEGPVAPQQLEAGK